MFYMDAFEEIECSLVGCKDKTTHPENADPRKRWIVNLELQADSAPSVFINLCPYHAREYLHLDEDFYLRVERSERLISSMN